MTTEAMEAQLKLMSNEIARLREHVQLWERSTLHALDPQKFNVLVVSADLSPNQVMTWQQMLNANGYPIKVIAVPESFHPQFGESSGDSPAPADNNGGLE